MMMEIERTMKPGNTNQDINEAARKAVYDYLGLLGHSLGTTGLNYPIVGEVRCRRERRRGSTQTRNDFQHRAGIFIPRVPGGGGVRLEDTILITEDGNEFFTTVPYDEDF